MNLHMDAYMESYIVFVQVMYHKTTGERLYGVGV